MKSGVRLSSLPPATFVMKPADGAVILAIAAMSERSRQHDWMAANNEQMTDCLVGPQPQPHGRTMIGRRGSMTAWFTFHGQQGHSAYPHRAKTAAAMARLMDRRQSHAGRWHRPLTPARSPLSQWITGNPPPT
jgi:succinyl-diaminopimelate desuccinylase